jgi:hypothetical protein
MRIFLLFLLLLALFAVACRNVAEETVRAAIREGEEVASKEQAGKLVSSAERAADRQRLAKSLSDIEQNKSKVVDQELLRTAAEKERRLKAILGLMEEIDGEELARKLETDSQADVKLIEQDLEADQSVEADDSISQRCLRTFEQRLDNAPMLMACTELKSLAATGDFASDEQLMGPFTKLDYQCLVKPGGTASLALKAVNNWKKRSAAYKTIREAKTTKEMLQATIKNARCPAGE